jgi:hypothetical protein
VAVGGGMRGNGWSAHGFVMVDEQLSSSIYFQRKHLEGEIEMVRRLTKIKE